MPPYKTHLALSIIPALYTISILDLYSINHLYPTLSLSFTLLGSLLPDIDTPYSFIGRKLLLISWLINKLFHHRGLFHSVIFYTVIFLILPLLHPTHIQYCTYGVILISLYVGILSHIISDRLFSLLKMKRRGYN